jgi:hypothetical protein
MCVLAIIFVPDPLAPVLKECRPPHVIGVDAEIADTTPLANVTLNAADGVGVVVPETVLVEVAEVFAHETALR